MSLLQEAITAGAVSHQPNLIRWSYHHRQATRSDKVAALTNPFCPEDVINDGYTQPVGLRLVAMTCARTTDQWDEAIVKETSVQILRKLIFEGYSRADQPLAARDDEVIGTLVKEAARMRVAHEYCEKMPQLFWKHSTPDRWSGVWPKQMIERLTSGECTQEQIQVLTYQAMQDVHSRLDSSSFRPTDEQCVAVNDVIDIHRDVLTGSVFYNELLQMQRVVNDTIRPVKRTRNGQGSALDAYPWLTTYPWTAKRQIKQSDLEIEGWSFESTLAELVDTGDYIGAGNFLMRTIVNVNDFAKWRATFDPDQRTALIRGWLTWALDNTDVTDFDISCFTYNVVGDGMHYDLLSSVRTPRFDRVLYEHFSTYEVFRVLGADMKLSDIRDLTDGQILISMMLSHADPTIVAAADQLADGWTGSLNELFAAAHLATC